MTENEYRGRILSSTLSPNARLVCHTLLYYRNRKTEQCNPSYNTLAESTGICRNSVIKAVKELDKAGCLTIVRKKAAKNQNHSNEYLFPICSAPDAPRSAQDALGGGARGSAPDGPKPIEPIKKGIFCFQEEKKLMDFGGDWGAYQEYMKEKGRLTGA